MKAILSVILASVILFLSAGFKVATHYCGDVAVSSSFSTSGTVEGCGMEMETKNDCNSEVPIISDANCCDDAVVNLEIEDDYQPSEKSFVDIDFQFVQAYVYVYFQNLFGGKGEVTFKEYSPPLVQHDIQVKNQVFLI